MKSLIAITLVSFMVVWLAQEDAMAAITNRTFNGVECVKKQKTTFKFNKTGGYNGGSELDVHSSNSTFDEIDEYDHQQGSVAGGFQEMWGFIKGNITFQVLSGVFIMHVSSLAVYFFCCRPKREAVNVPELLDDVESVPFSMSPTTVVDSYAVKEPYDVQQRVKSFTGHCVICQKAVCV